MNEPKIKLLLQLADHLENGKLGHQRFHFGFYNGGPTDDRYADTPELKNCGTSGCAIGECPFIFPGWFFNVHFEPRYEKYASTVLSATGFFDLDWLQYLHLFINNSHRIEAYGGKLLNAQASRIEVAGNIRTFCRIMEVKM
jgi:hypothetical protein